MADDPRYREALGYLAPGYFRITHEDLVSPAAESPGSWMDAEGVAWDADRVLRSVRNVQEALPSASEVTVVIDRWPPRMDADGDGKLDADRKAEFATLCAELVGILGRLDKPVAAIEVTDGLDAVYEARPLADDQPSEALELAEIISLAAVSIRDVWPDAPLAGPGARALDNAPFHRGLALALSFGGFAAYSFGLDPAHGGESGIGGDGGAMPTPGAVIREIGAIVALQPQRMDTVLSRFGPSGQAGMRAAAWDVWLTVEAVAAGCDAVAGWCDLADDGGRIGPGFGIRASGHAMHLANKMLAGKLLADCTVAGGGDWLRALAVRDGTTGPMVLLVNGGPGPREVALDGDGWSVSYEVTDEGIREVPLAAGSVTLRGFGVAIVR
ncbi:hypothetical protein BH23VER1_BH23VER1_04900 [soil metagenome]